MLKQGQDYDLEQMKQIYQIIHLLQLKENDEKYNKASSNVDLDEIKRIAMEEYGMTYADENQIVTYSDEGGDDYVRQNEAIPQK